MAGIGGAGASLSLPASVPLIYRSGSVLISGNSSSGLGQGPENTFFSGLESFFVHVLGSNDSFYYLAQVKVCLILQDDSMLFNAR